MADFFEMRRLLDKIECAEAGMSVNMMKVTEDIKQLREAGEEVSQRICQGALDGKKIGNWLFKRTEFQYNEDDDGWACAYIMQTEDTGSTDINVGERPATMTDPAEPITGSEDYIMKVSVYAIFGDNSSGGYAWYGEIQDLTIDGNFNTSEPEYDVEVEGDAERPLEALQVLISNIEAEMNVALENLGPSEPEFDDRGMDGYNY